MAIPLPKPPEAGGDIVAAARSVNALRSDILKAKMQELQNQYYGPLTESKIRDTEANTDYRNALTNKTNTLLPHEAESIRLRNALYPELTRAHINNINSMSKFRGTGGFGGLAGASVKQKDLMALFNDISDLNPHLKGDKRKIKEAINIYSKGGDKLADGTKLNPLTFFEESDFDAVLRNRTPAPVLTGTIKGGQAEAELKVFEDFVKSTLGRYGTTYLGMSPKQVFDSYKDAFGNDPEAQEELGKLIAAQAILYEIAQIRMRLSGGEPGIHATKKLIKLSEKAIKTVMPYMSAESRLSASKHMDEVLSSGFNARTRAGFSPFEVMKNANKNSNENSKNEKVTVMTPDGQVWNIPKEKVEEAIKRGAKRI